MEEKMSAYDIRVTREGGSPGKPLNSAPRSQDPLPAESGRNILVTGGAGYIGSHTCKALATAGFSPVVFDNLSTGHPWAVRWGPLIEGDLENRDQLIDVLRQYSIRSVIHFAASAYVHESMENPGKYFRNNAAHTINLLDAMVEAAVEPIVFSSSCATYGIPHQLPISETHPQNPINPYGESKRMVEKMLHWYGVAHGLRSYALRYFNAAGDDPDGEIGEVHDPETHLVPLVAQAALGQREHVHIYGTDYDTPDGSNVRDYVHVMDLAQAHVLAVEQLLAGGGSRRLNLGTGTGRSVREIVSAVERLSGRRVRTIELPRRPGDPALLVAAPAEASKILGWEPRNSDLRGWNVNTTCRIDRFSGCRNNRAPRRYHPPRSPGQVPLCRRGKILGQGGHLRNLPPRCRRRTVPAARHRPEGFCSHGRPWNQHGPHLYPCADLAAG
jgi:UDP-arabinose 4-epimerase